MKNELKSLQCAHIDDANTKAHDVTKIGVGAAHAHTNDATNEANELQ